jgi:CheY-like chemotaxis protein
MLIPMPISALIVEDDLVTRQALAGALRNGGVATVLTCGSGEEALVAATQTPVDVALVDIGLPGISGIETIRRLRESRPNLPALVLTVVESAQKIVAAFEAGASG